MAYRVEVGPKANAQLSELDSTIGSAVERKIIWLVQNAAVMIHRRLVGMPGQGSAVASPPWLRRGQPGLRD